VRSFADPISGALGGASLVPVFTDTNVRYWVLSGDLASQLSAWLTLLHTGAKVA
jgi:hypothetical protein